MNTRLIAARRAATLSLALLMTSVATTAPAIAAPPAMSPVTVPAEAAPVERFEHISIQVTGKADGPAVFLIPGLASPRAVWDGVVPDLAKTHRVYLVQVNGFGGDDIGANDKPGVLDGIARELAAYITTRKIRNAAIAGHSMGGLLAMMMGARHPDATGSVLVVDSLPYFSLLFGPDATVDSVKPRAEMMRQMTLATPTPAGPVTSDPGGIWSITPAGRIKVANWGNVADKRAVAQAMYEVMTTDLRPELAKVQAKPFTVLYATGAGPQATALWQAGYAGSPATLVPVADSWHFIMLDQPDVFKTALKSFLNTK